MNQRNDITPHSAATRVAALTGFIAVLTGAFGAHGLKVLLAHNDTAAVWDKAVFYHSVHAVMLFLLADRKPFPTVAWWSFLAGIFFFSGSLYLLALTGDRWLGAITPLGGVSLMVGWLALALNWGRNH